LLFLKAPRSGEVKTRLASSIGNAAAVRAYRALVEGQCRRLPQRASTEVHFSPRDAAIDLQQWLGNDLTLYPQAGGTLGTRLLCAVEDAFARGADKVLCIGGDCPQLDQQHIEQATAALHSDCDVVFGPSEDGGYYLIGLNAPHPQLFANIPWSTPNTLDASLQQAAKLGLRVKLLETLYDIDELPELKRAIQAGYLPADLLAE
jgi:rSAM/selenodomain-associated transferase 1